MKKRSLCDVEVKGLRVLVRVDFNVPLKDGEVADDTRLRASLPTIQHLLERGAKVILMSHLGRPREVPREKWDSLRLDPVARRLSELLGRAVKKVDDCVGFEVEGAVAALQEGEVLLLENTRFHPEEEKNDLEFAQKLARLGDLFVNDAFGAAHRAHASTEGVARYLPSALGFLMERELSVLSEALTSPARPFVVLFGGAKVSDKIGVVRNVLPKADRILIGGGMAYTFLKAQGKEIGKSILDEEHLEDVKEVLRLAEELGVEVVLPVDVVVADRFHEAAQRKVVSVDEIPADWMGLDIGPATRERFIEALRDAGTVLWNGPMGVFEMEPFAAGTRALAEAVASREGAKTIIGGGDTIRAVQEAGVAEKIYHICTGGGASLEFLEGRRLPGVAAINNLRRPVVAANWKMHKTIGEALGFVNAWRERAAQIQRTDVVLCAPFTALASLAQAVEGLPVAVGAQDLFWEKQGAYTGEISPTMLTDAGCYYVIVGHSERRGRFGSYDRFPDPALLGVFGDNDTTVRAKVKAALENGLTPILCVGETLPERQQGITDEVVSLQVKRALWGLHPKEVERVVIAYEPVWAIGTGEVCDAPEANRVIGLIRQILCEVFGEDVARSVRILYGGSINPSNFGEIVHQPEVDGGLVGGASLDPDSFAQLVELCEQF